PCPEPVSCSTFFSAYSTPEILTSGRCHLRRILRHFAEYTEHHGILELTSTWVACPAECDRSALLGQPARHGLGRVRPAMDLARLGHHQAPVGLFKRLNDIVRDDPHGFPPPLWVDRK